jgi:hypothetical protein
MKGKTARIKLEEVSSTAVELQRHCVCGCSSEGAKGPMSGFQHGALHFPIDGNGK